MGDTFTMRSLLSQDEIDALFSLVPSKDSSLSNPCETSHVSIANRCHNPGGASSMPVSEPEMGKGVVESQNGDVSADIITSKSPVTLAEETTLAISLHGYLTLEGILRSCSQALREHFPLRCISFVQPRANSATATVYSLNERADSPSIGPHVIAIEPSRLKECLLKQQKLITYSVRVSELDDIERDYLLELHPNPGAVSIVYWPLTLQGKLKGVLVLGLPETERLTATRTAFLSHMADHLAVAIENSDRYYVERRRSRQSSIVSEIAVQATSGDDVNKFFLEVCKLLRTSFDYDSVQIWIETCDQLDLMGQASRSPNEVVVGQRVPAMALQCRQRGQIIYNNDLHSEFGTEPNREGRSQLAAPIHFGGKCSGVLFIDSSRLDTFASEDVNGMESVACLIASKLHNLQVYKNSQRSGEYLQAILEAANDWGILSTDIQGYVITCSVGSQKVFRLSKQEILGTDLLNLFTNPRMQRELITFIRGGATASYLERFHVPQTSGNVTAYLDVTFQRVHNHEKQHIGFLCVVRDVTEKLLLLQKLKELSITDDVTDLYNQRGFFRVLETEMRRSQKSHHSFSLCFLDLDCLKQFNDTYGHLAGSRALRETASLLRELVRAGMDTCCRYGGDEFAIIMPQTSKIEAQVAIERIRVKLSEHFQGKITASFGIADVSDNILEATELLARADRAMYRAKSRGKNCVVLSD